MRIIIGRDYYDRAMAYGFDESVVFVRSRDQFIETKQVPIGKPKIIFSLAKIDSKSKTVITNRWNSMSFYVPRLNLGNVDYQCLATCAVVCGKIHNGIVIRETFAKDDHFFWSFESLNTYLQDFGLSALETSRGWMRSTNLIEYFKVRDSSKEFLSWLIDHKVTILTYVPNFLQIDDGWRVNGDNLKDIQFFKVIDPVTMFQEISQFVGGIIPRDGNPTIEITDDNIKVAKHGFDKFSFRKMKEKT